MVLQQIEAEILPSARLSHYETPSASVAIVEGDELETHVFTTGDENSETLYLADSNSKSITSIGVARLVDQGLLSFEDKITDYVDAESFLHDPDSGHMIQHVTIRMLMTHTSGLVKKNICDHSGMPDFAGHACWQFNHFPGSKWHYDNAFGLVQQAMEKVAGKAFPDLMRDLVTKPLGMTRTFWGNLATTEMNFARPHFKGVEVSLPQPYHQAELSTYGMWTTASDLLRAISAVQKSLQASSSFLSQATAEFMLITGARPMRAIGESPEQLGLGWFVTSAAFGHRGCRQTNGYHSYFFGFHGQEARGLQFTSCAIMTNAFEGLQPIRDLINAVMYLKRWPRQLIMPSNLGIDAALPRAAPAKTLIDSSWADWRGTWSRGSQQGCE